MDIEKMLTGFDLTEQEANIYVSLVINGKMTGYEVAKQTGISRSNVYTSLTGMVDKGALYMIEDRAKHYIPVPIEEFCNNKIRDLQKLKQNLIKNMPEQQKNTEGYITIKGKDNILNKIKNMLKQTRKRIYISTSNKTLQEIKSQLEKAVSENLKVVIITNPPFNLTGAKVYHAEKSQQQIRLIVDSRKVLTGDIKNGSNSTCLYSKKKNLVDLFKEALKNEITLIELQK